MDSLTWIKRYLEGLSYKWPPRKEARKRARRLSQLSDKRVKYESQCAACKEWFRESQTHLDHIVPKGKYSRETFFVWLDRFLCKAEGFQVLCIPCHAKKTADEHKTGAYK